MANWTKRRERWGNYKTVQANPDFKVEQEGPGLWRIHERFESGTYYPLSEEFSTSDAANRALVEYLTKQAAKQQATSDATRAATATGTPPPAVEFPKS